MCFLEPSTNNICVARESLLTSKPILKALLIFTHASLGFIGTYMKKSNFIPFGDFVPAPAEGWGREQRRWGSLGLPWSFQAKGESTSAILGCSTKAFLPRSCWRRKQHCLPRRCLPSGRKPAIESSCLPSLPHHPHHLPPQKLLHACEAEGGM